jgi:hypothetical protein
VRTSRGLPNLNAEALPSEIVVGVAMTPPSSLNVVSVRTSVAPPVARLNVVPVESPIQTV